MFTIIWGYLVAQQQEIEYSIEWLCDVQFQFEVYTTLASFPGLGEGNTIPAVGMLVAPFGEHQNTYRVTYQITLL